MSRSLVWHALTVACLLCLGCASSPSVDVNTEIQTIRELDRQWNEAFLEKDIQGAMRFFAPDALLMPAHSPSITGKEAIQAWFEAWLPNSAVTSTFAPEEIEVAASGDLAYDRGRYEFTMETPEGRVRDVGKYLIVWERIDGEWKAVFDMSNSDLPAPELLTGEDVDPQGG